MTARIAVIGGGIAGLAAALRVRERLPAARITVYEQGGVLGGKLRTGSLAGAAVEHGAEAFLTREPGGPGDSAAVALARRVGLGDDLVHPEPVPPALVLGGRLCRVPGGTLFGVPADPAQVAAVAAADPARDRDDGAPVLDAGADAAVGELVRRRLGDQVVDRLVDPMLGGVYAGRADMLSLAATMPGLAAACRTERTLTGAVRAALAAPPRPALAAPPRPAGTPVFTTVRGGMGRLVDAVAAASGATVRCGAAVRELTGSGPRWRLAVGSTREPELVEADAVVLAVPARPAARLLRGVDRTAAELVGVLDYAGVALVTFAFPPGLELPELSGLLVPAGEGTLTKAATFFTRKWAHLRRDNGPVLVRASVGRYGEEQVLHRDDAALVSTVRGELSALLDRALPDPVAAHVQRWGGSLPQYAPGHLDRVVAVRAALPDTLRLAGAGYDGVGIPACVRSGQTAAEQILAGLGESGV